MKLITKICLISSAIAVALGIIFTIAGLLLGAQRAVYVTKHGIDIPDVTYDTDKSDFKLDKTELEDFDSMDIKLEAGSLDIQKSDDDKCYIEYSYTYVLSAPKYEVKDGTLKYDDSSVSNSYNGEHALFSYDFDWHKDMALDSRRSCTLYIPEGKKFDEVKLDMDAGNLSVEELNASLVDINCDAGNIDIEYIDADKLTCDEAAGNIDIDEAHGDKVKISNDCGIIDISYLECDKCEIDNAAGDIDVTLAGEQDDYDYELSTSLGDITLDGKSVHLDYETENGCDKFVDMESSIGNVSISFK